MNSTPSTLEKNRTKKIAEELGTLLSDTYLLYIKSQNFHWNIVDPKFHSLHVFFEKQYEELAEAVDLIAERIRSLGQKAPGSMKEFLERTRLEESLSPLTGDEMLKALLEDHESIIQWLKEEIEETIQLGDQGSSDLCVERLRAHEKTAWMINAQIHGKSL